MADTFKWTVVLVALMLGLGFVLNTRLIPTLPIMLHWVIGIIFIFLGGTIAYKALK